MNSKNRCASLLVGAFFLSFSLHAAEEKKKPAKPASGETPDTAWLNDVTRIPPGENQNLDPVYIEFGLSWNNVLNAGKLAVGVAKTDADEGENVAAYLGGANGKSSGLARALWPYDFECASVVRQDNLRPIAFNMKEKERNRTLDYHILFESKKLVCSTTKLKEDGTEDSVTHLLTYKHDFGQDLFSAILYLRSLPLENGDEVDMVVTPFNRPYLAKFKVEGREKKKVKGTKYDTIKLDVEIGKINKDLTIKNYDKMKTATIWLSEDEFRLPIEIHADLSVGFVSARMTKREWSIQEEEATAPAASGSATPPTATKYSPNDGSANLNRIQEEKKKKKDSFLKRLFQ